MGLEFDHLAVSCADLGAGAAVLEALLGVPLAEGGKHATMGTHNRLLSLGPREYLEVIAIDPAAPSPGRPRWFGLDRFEGPPRLTNWVARADDIAAHPVPGTTVAELSRGEFRWRSGIPDDGTLPFDDVHPMLIEWQGAAHPAAHLPDRGCRLVRLVLAHPQAEALRATLAPVLGDGRIEVVAGPASVRAEIASPAGLRWLP